jgi:hypothetical protein
MALEGFAGVTAMEMSGLVLPRPLTGTKLELPEARWGGVGVPGRASSESALVEGLDLTWANAEEPRTRKKSKRAVPPKKLLIPYFAGLEL